MARLSVIVIHHRTPDLLRECLFRIARYAPEAGVSLVDTAPDAGLFRELGALYPGLELLEAPNHSLAQAVNTGLKRSDGRFIAHLNADVLVGPETFDALLRAVELPGVGMAGPVCFDGNLELQNQGPLYRLHYLRLGAGRLVSRLEGATSPVGSRAGPRTVRVPWLSGSIQLVRREAIDAVGGMDTSLRFYNEDIEWCWRLRRSGYACCLTATPVLHRGGSSTPGRAEFLIEGYRGGMILSRRFRPPWFRGIHRWAVLAGSSLAGRAARSGAAGEAHRRITEMFRRRAFDESPFGPSLETANPDFLAETGERRGDRGG